MNTIRLDLVRVGDCYTSKLAEAFATELHGTLYIERRLAVCTLENFFAVKDHALANNWTVLDENFVSETKHRGIVFKTPHDQYVIGLSLRKNELSFEIFAPINYSESRLQDIRDFVTENAMGDSNFFRIRAKDYSSPSITVCHKPQTTNLKLYPGLDYKAITKALAGNTPGFVLFQGPPGVGKSRLIEHIIHSMPETKFVSLADPKLLRGSIEDLAYIINNNVLVIEEGDSFVKSRDANPAFMPEILDMTDGHYANELNIKFLITTNLKDDELDKAVIRKNRMLFSQKFRELTKQEVRDLNKEGIINVPNELITDNMTLADIFGDEDNGIEAKTKKAMGFH